MPGLSGRNPVPGMYGIGKIKVRFVPRKKISYVGLYCFLLGIGLYIFSKYWFTPHYREYDIIPRLHTIMHYTDKTWLFLNRNLRPATFVNSDFNFKVQRSVALGEPSIVSATTRDVIYGQGFTHAHDRLFQMDILRSVALGKLSELFGTRYLASDKMYRILNIKNLALSDLKDLSKENLDYLEAYAKGVNDFLASMQVMPLEYPFGHQVRLWEVIDTLAILRLLALQWSHGVDFGLVSPFLEKLGIDEETSVPDISNIIPSIGMRVLAISGKHSSSGAAVLVTDVLGLLGETASTIWYPNSLRSNSLNVSGASLPGVPFVIFGHNDHYAWSAAISSSKPNEDISILQFKKSQSSTSNSSATDDGYVLTNEYIDPTRKPLDLKSAPLITVVSSTKSAISKISFDFNETARADSMQSCSSDAFVCHAVVRTEEISVIGDSNSPVYIQVLDTIHGPAMVEFLSVSIESQGEDDSLVAVPVFRSAVLSSDSTSSSKKGSSIDALLQINKAKSFDEFVDAAILFSSASLHFIYADKAGNIGSVLSNSLDSSKQCIDLTHVEKKVSDSKGCGKIISFNPKEGIILATGDTSNAATPRLTELLHSMLKEAMEQKQLLSSEPLLDKVHRIFDDVYSSSSILLAQAIDSVTPGEGFFSGSTANLDKVVSAQMMVSGFNGTISGPSHAIIIIELFRYEMFARIVERLPTFVVASLRGDLLLYPLKRYSALWSICNRVIKDLLENRETSLAWKNAKISGSFNAFVHDSLILAMMTYEESYAEYKHVSWDLIHASVYPSDQAINRKKFSEYLLGRDFIALPGTVDTLFPSFHNNFDFRGQAPQLRISVDTGDWDAMKVVIPLGVSERIGSDYFYRPTRSLMFGDNNASTTTWYL